MVCVCVGGGGGGGGGGIMNFLSPYFWEGRGRKKLSDGNESRTNLVDSNENVDPPPPPNTHLIMNYSSLMHPETSNCIQFWPFFVQ